MSPWEPEPLRQGCFSGGRCGRTGDPALLCGRCWGGEARSVPWWGTGGAVGTAVVCRAGGRGRRTDVGGLLRRPVVGETLKARQLVRVAGPLPWVLCTQVRRYVRGFAGLCKVRLGVGGVEKAGSG